MENTNLAVVVNMLEMMKNDMKRIDKKLELTLACVGTDTDHIRRDVLIKKYGLGNSTLSKWENEGLHRIKKDHRTVFYEKKELARFLKRYVQ